MIEVRKGDLFASEAQAIVNTVNCVGVMGKGIALEFKKRYPEMYSEYALLCRREYIETGRVWIWHHLKKCESCNGFGHTDNHVTGRVECSECEGTGCEYPLFVVNFPTKKDWRNPSRSGLITRWSEVRVLPPLEISWRLPFFYLETSKWNSKNRTNSTVGLKSRSTATIRNRPGNDASFRNSGLIPNDHWKK